MGAYRAITGSLWVRADSGVLTGFRRCQKNPKMGAKRGGREERGGERGGVEPLADVVGRLAGEAGPLQDVVEGMNRTQLQALPLVVGGGGRGEGKVGPPPRIGGGVGRAS